MQIKINSKPNQKMLENYPDDPYSDLCIITQTRRLNLVLAYLSIDSTFFANIDPDTRQINLTHLNEQPLIRIIRSLYGQKLIANTISQLTQLFQIIKQLQIDDYKANIQKQILQKPFIMESIQFLEFSFSNNILIKQVIQTHIQNKLKLLQNNRNYLQLNKISISTFQALVQKFIQRVIKKYGSIQNLLKQPQSQIVNHVMENYFNRNNIKAINYFKQSNSANCKDMEVIWNKYHHSVYFTPTSSNLIGQSMINLNPLRGAASQMLSVKSPTNQNRLRKKSEEVINVNLPQNNSSHVSPQIQKKKQKVQFLEEQIKQRDSIIAQLQKQINQLKQVKQHKIGKKNSGLGTGNQNNPIPQVLDEDDFKQEIAQQSLSFLPNIKKTRKSKQYEQQQDFTVSSVFEPAIIGNRKIPQVKQIRTMKKLTGNMPKNKFLPN